MADEKIADFIKRVRDEGKDYIYENGRLKKIKVYEFTVAIRPDLSEDQGNIFMETLKNFISEKLGRIIKEEKWGERVLAYPIGRYDRAKYFYFEYESTGNGDVEFRKFLETSQEVLRYLIVKKEKIETRGHIWRRKVKQELSQQ